MSVITTLNSTDSGSVSRGVINTNFANLNTDLILAGTVTTLSIVTANGISGSVATATTTPAITLTLGAITPTSVNGLIITTTTGTFTLTSGKTLSVSNTLTLTGTDSSSIAFGTGGTVAYTNTTTLSSLVSIGTITTGTWTATVIAGQYGGTGVANTGKTITLGNNITTSGNFALTLTQTATTSVTLPITGTLHSSGVANNFGAFTAYFTETDNGNSSTADTIDWGVSNKQRSTLTGNCTLTFTAPAGPASLVYKVLTGAGSFTVTWPATVHWAGGVAPTITTTASKIDIITFYWDGTTYFGNFSQNYTP